MSGYTKDEMMTVEAARRLARRRRLLRRHRAPEPRREPGAPHCTRRTACSIYESGTIGAKPTVPPLSIGDGELAETADAVVSVPEMFAYWLQGGRIDVGFLGAAQIDRFGNLNSTVIGEYEQPEGEAARRRRRARDRPRLPGGVRDAAAVERGRSSSELDFLSSAGDRVSTVVTDIGVLEPDPETRELTLAALHPGATVEQAREATGWPLRVAEHAARRRRRRAADELAALRSSRERRRDAA